MTWLFVRLQWANWLREPRLFVLLVAVGLALGAASAWSTATDATQMRAHAEAAASARTEWERLGDDVHPHLMAHFGDFAFRPTGPLARLDRGVQARLGKVLRIEAHRQGSPLHADIARAGTAARFPRPDAAFLLQTVIPLVLIFLGAAGLASDRATGRLKQALVQGAGARAILAGHWLSLWCVGLFMLAVVVISSVSASLFLGGGTVHVQRLGAFVGTHAVFLAVIAGAVVAASVWMRSASAALLTLLALWVVGTSLMPRAAANVAGAWVPLPSRDAFQTQMIEAREAGPDGHNPRDTIIEERRQEVLDEYGVDDVEDLPIDFGGIAMQLDEDFGNQVWDEHFGQLTDLFMRQVAVTTGAAVFNPFQAIDHVSMALAGTDLAHDVAFQDQAEQHRRAMVRMLNHEHAHGEYESAKGGRAAKAQFYASMPPFHYVAPSLEEVVAHRRFELFALGVWLIVVGGAMVVGADRLERGRLPC